MTETLTNVMGAVVVNDANICTACQLARMLERGVLSPAVEAGHSSCEGNEQMPCACGCDYSRGHACKECLRKGMDLDEGGQCRDRRDCANAILMAAAARKADRVQKAAEAPPKRSGGRASGAPRDCHCGCGEQTGGGMYRPGHDARHVSQLTARVKAGELTVEAAEREVAHSDKLIAKLHKAVGA